MLRNNDVLWKVKEIEVMTEKTVQKFLGFLDPTDYRLPACHDSAIPEEVK
ncbi:MAG: hypothetical protein ICV56_08675 [Nitrososphaeraceae archaeon]|nr:hypothetical protein [Nitrososphaeraceae archaeon]